MNTEAVAHAAEVIRSGGVVAYPTESCFGLGCDPRNIAAVRRILRIKRRQRAKGMILIADRYARLLPYMDLNAISDRREAIYNSLLSRHTWLLPANKGVSSWLRGCHATIAVRMTAHRTAARLCQLARTAIVSTSANRSGKRMLRSACAVLREFGDEVDFIVDERIGCARAPSIIRHFENGEIVRA